MPQIRFARLNGIIKLIESNSGHMPNPSSWLLSMLWVQLFSDYSARKKATGTLKSTCWVRLLRVQSSPSSTQDSSCFTLKYKSRSMMPSTRPGTRPQAPKFAWPYSPLYLLPTELKLQKHSWSSFHNGTTVDGSAERRKMTSALENLSKLTTKTRTWEATSTWQEGLTPSTPSYS